MKAGIIIDMHGCPNRCRHCWLGQYPDPKMSVDDLRWVAGQFRDYQKDGEPFFSELEFHTWYREPDYSDDYRELWQVAHELSDVAYPHWELASVWRIVRDTGYIEWLREIGLKVIQVTLYGTEKNTDYFTGRKGAYRDILKAIDIMLEHGIIPRVQIFPFTTTLEDVSLLPAVFKDSHIEERIRNLGEEFFCFLNTFTPMGEGFKLLDITLRKGDFEKLPSYLIEKSLRHRNLGSIADFWKTEAELLPELLEDENPLNDDTDFPAFNIDKDYNVYPTSGEITEWWNLGNLRTDGVSPIMETFLACGIPGMKMNKAIPVSYFAKKYGDPDGDTLWVKADLVIKWMRMEAMGL